MNMLENCERNVFMTAFLLMTMIVISMGTQSLYADDTFNIADLDLENLLDEVVISASKHEETLEETPANVYIITSKTMAIYGCQSIADALTLVPGIYITDDYSYSQIGVRGLAFAGDWNSHVMLMIDGRPVLDQYSGSSSIDVSGLDISNIDRIEVVKGPASSLYGSNAFLGIVNLITKSENRNSAVLNNSYFENTRFTKNNLFLDYHFDNNIKFKLTGSWLDRGGNKLFFKEFSDMEDETLFALDEEGFNQFYLDSADFTGGYSDRRNTREAFFTHSTISWKNLALTVHAARQKNGVSSSFYGSVFNRPENHYDEYMAYADLIYFDHLTSNLELYTRLSVQHYHWKDHILYNYYAEEDSPDYLPGPVWIDEEHDQAYSAEARIRYDFNKSNTAILGTEVQFHEIRHESGEADTGGDDIVENIIPADNVEYNGEIFNLYFMDEHRFTNRIKAVGGLHFNYFTYTTGKVMPKAALVVKPYDKGTLKFIASRGFRSPSFYQLTFDDGDFFIGNPDLEPELISSYEVIAVQQFPYGFQADLSGNYSRISNLIIQKIIDTSDPAHFGGDYPEEISQHRNLGKIETKSLELSLRRNPIYKLSGYFNVTYQNVANLDDEQDDEPYNSPHWLANLGFAYQAIPGQMTLSLRTNYTSELTLWDGDKLEDQFSLDAFMNLFGFWNVFDVTVGVTNILDNDNRAPLSYDYAPSNSIKRPGRSLYINLKTTLGL